MEWDWGCRGGGLKSVSIRMMSEINYWIPTLVFILYPIDPYTYPWFHWHFFPPHLPPFSSAYKFIPNAETTGTDISDILTVRTGHDDQKSVSAESSHKRHVQYEITDFGFQIGVLVLWWKYETAYKLVGFSIKQLSIMGEKKYQRIIISISLLPLLYRGFGWLKDVQRGCRHRRIINHLQIFSQLVYLKCIFSDKNLIDVFTWLW